MQPRPPMNPLGYTLLLGLAVVTACQGGEDSGHTATTTATSTTTSTTTSTGTATSTGTTTSTSTTTTHDTGDIDPGLLVDATLEEGGTVTCADPGARTAQGPMQQVTDGGDWDTMAFPWENTRGYGKGRGLAIGDFDGDGWNDVFLPNYGPEQLFMNNGDGTFTDESVARLPALAVDPFTVDKSHSAAVADCEGDGDLDLFIVERGKPSKLYQNDGTGTFIQIENNVSGIQVDGHGKTGAAFGDLDKDGDLDLFVYSHFVGPDSPTWDPTTDPADPSQLYLNNGDCTFTDVSTTHIPQYATDAYTYAGGIWDLDMDAWPDLYFVNDFGAERQANVFLRNLMGSTGSLAFEDVGGGLGLSEVLFGMGLAVNDLNQDRLPDLVMTSWDNIVLKESTGTAASWINTAQSRGLVAEYNKRDIAWGVDLNDYDNDGRLDVVLAFGWLSEDHEGLGNPKNQPDALFLGQGSEPWKVDSFTQVAEAWGVDEDTVQRGLVGADLNNDGFLDLVKADLEGDATMHLSRCDEKAWLGVDLDWTASKNRDGVGAQVIAWVGNTPLSRWVHAGGSSYSSAGPVEVHFGLADVDVVDQLVVIWPDGKKSSFEDVPSRQRVTVVRSQ